MNKSKIIKNSTKLETTKLRRDALAIAEAGLRAIDTKTVLENSILLDEDILKIQGRSFNLSAFNNIYVVGFGKVSCTAAYTLEKILTDRITTGAVIGVAEKVCQVIETYSGTHPLPSQKNYTATKHIAEVARSAKENDLVLVVISGGGSALLCSSMGECDQGSALFKSFLSSGGTIEELNIVRKHISNLKGGGLAQALYPATVIGLVFSDVPGGDMTAVASGPTYFDDSTISDAQSIIDKYNLGDFHLVETPKDPKFFKRVNNFTIVSNVTALNAMQEESKCLSYKASLISATQYATAEETRALFLTNTTSGAVQCMGGETKLIVPKDCEGIGGRNSHLALSMLESLKDNQIFISLASDGNDNSEYAGAIVDLEVMNKAKQTKITSADYLNTFDSLAFFNQVGGCIETGKLESNVSDLMLLLTEKTHTKDVLITDVSGVVVKDSRGIPTISVTITAGEYIGTFDVPSGASTGEHEVTVLRTEQALKMLETVIKPVILGKNIRAQTEIDQCLHEIDGTDCLSVIGGNTALGVSIAVCKAAAQAEGVEVWQWISELFDYKKQALAPRLFVNLINGGKHAKYGSDIQEHQIIPDTDDVHLAFMSAKQVQRSLLEVLSKKYQQHEISIGDEGGYVIPSQTVSEPFEYIAEAVEKAGVEIPILLGADIAASSFYSDNEYVLGGKKYTSADLVDMYGEIHTKFPLLQMIEDPFEERDFAAFAMYKKTYPDVLIIGDDLTTTNKRELLRALKEDSINAIIVKPNQIGTLTDTLETMSIAYENNIRCIVSHRSGETMDNFIADLAMGTKCFGLKAGAPDKIERAVKYNRLLEIKSC